MIGANYITENRLTTEEREHLDGKPLWYTCIHRGEVMVMTSTDPLRLDWEEGSISRYEVEEMQAAHIYQMINKLLDNQRFQI